MDNRGGFTATAILQMIKESTLLRVLQERVVVSVGGTEATPINVRVIAATNRDLAREVEYNRFRLDLYYRLNVVPIKMAPLCERREDIEPLAHHFAQQAAALSGLPRVEFTNQALAVLERYHWPGNVRQLQNIIERAIVFATDQRIDAPLLRRWLDDTSACDVAAPPGSQPWITFDQAERALLLRTLEQTNYNRAAAARLLQIDYRRLNRLIRRHAIALPTIHASRNG